MTANGGQGARESAPPSKKNRVDKSTESAPTDEVVRNNEDLTVTTTTIPFIPDSVFYKHEEFDLSRLRQLVAKHTRRAMGTEPVQILQKMDPLDPPLSYAYVGTSFMVRDCYEVYYDLAMGCLLSSELIYLTIVGTPGTGKSLFYIYTSNRIRRELPYVTIVAVTFGKNCVMRKCLVYRKNAKPKQYKSIPEIKDAIYLYDGPPTQLPPCGKMICFTCPNKVWLGFNTKEPRHRYLWFPSWTLEEMQTANSVCELGIAPETIKERFEFFGGSARHCLSRDPGFVENAREEIICKISNIKTIEQLATCFKSGNVDHDFSHQIFHWSPRIFDDFPFVQRTNRQYVCSKEVDDLICKHLIECRNDRHREFIQIIRFIPSFSHARGTLFEDFAAHTFSKDCWYTMRVLDGEATETVDFAMVAGSYKRMKPGCESVDGVAVIDNVVYLFQVTVAETHPVNAHGILMRLRELECYSSFLEGMQNVRLVFVLSRDADKFSRQTINPVESIPDDSSLYSVKGMRKLWIQELAERQVTTVGEFKELSDRKYQAVINECRMRQEHSKHNARVNVIPQYVMELADFEKRRSLTDENKQLREKLDEMRRSLTEIKQLREDFEEMKRKYIGSGG